MELNNNKIRIALTVVTVILVIDTACHPIVAIAFVVVVVAASLSSSLSTPYSYFCATLFIII